MTPRLSPAEPPYPPRVAAALARLTPPAAEPLALFRTLARDERLFSRLCAAGSDTRSVFDLVVR